MSDRFMIGLLGLMITIAVLGGVGRLIIWHSARGDRTTSADAGSIETRLARAEAAVNEAQRELASVREELAGQR